MVTNLSTGLLMADQAILRWKKQVAMLSDFHSVGSRKELEEVFIGR